MRDRTIIGFSLLTLVLFALMAGSGVGLWWRWEPWIQDSTRDGTEPSVEFLVKAMVADKDSNFGNLLARVANHDCVEVVDKPSGKVFAATERQPQQVSCVQFSPNGKTFAATGWDDVRIFDTQTAKLLTIVDKGCCYHAEYSADGKRLFIAILENGSPFMKVYSCRRPEWWWGVAWLPEFWFTGVLALSLLWSLFRDWKLFRYGAVVSST